MRLAAQHIFGCALLQQSGYPIAGGVASLKLQEVRTYVRVQSAHDALIRAGCSRY